MGASHLFASLTLFCFAQSAFTQSVPIPMDAGGRPLTDDRNGRLEYATAPSKASLLATQATAQPIATSTQPTRKKISRQRTTARLQKTGISPSYDIVWRTSAFGSGIGATGIWPIDADADGDLEIVLGGGLYFGGNAHWSIVDYNEDESSYEIAWQSAPYYVYGGWTPEITALRAVEVGSTKRVWVGRSDGKIDVVNVLTRELVESLSPSIGAITDFAIADADNDGDLDVAALTSTHLHLFDPETLSPTGTFAHGGNRLAIGNVDDDDRLEVVLNTGHVLEISGSSATIQWQASTAFGSRVALADIDADGRDELVAAEAWYLIRAWDIEAESLKWSYNADLDIGALQLIDVTGDDVPEIVYGDNQWGEIHVLDAATRAELWNIPNPEHGTTDVAVFDSDGDGELELLWGAGWSSSGPDHLFVHDVATRAFEWQNRDYSGPYSAVDLGDVDADGEIEIVVASVESHSGYGNGLVMVFDASSNELEWISQSDTLNGYATSGMRALKLVNVDADPQLEIVIGTDSSYDGALYVIDGLTHQLQNDAIFDSGSPLAALDAEDLTGDGRPEIIAGNDVAHTGSPGVFIYVIDPVTDAVLWRSAALASGFSQVSDIEAADVGAPGIDLLAVSDSVHVVRWSDRRHLTSDTSGYQAATAGDVDEAAGAEILAATTLGAIDVLDGETLDVLASHDVCDAPITAIQMHASNQVVLTCDSTLIVYSLTTQSIVDSTPVPVAQLGANASLTRTIDGDRSLILTGGDQAALFVDLSANGVPSVEPRVSTLHWRATADLQLVATDPDGDSLRFELVSLPELGSVMWLDANQGRLQYVGGIDVGNDSLLVRVSDGSQYSAPQAVTLTLTNAAPIADTTSLSLHWRGEQTVTLPATDPDGDPLEFTMSSAPTRGSATLNASTGVLTYTPSGASLDTDTFSYTLSDGPATTTVVAEITLTNTTPLADAAEYNITRGTTISGRFRATDANDDPLTFAIVEAPDQGTLTFEADTGLFEYVPASNGTGTDTVSFSVGDGVSQSQAIVEFNYPTATPPSGGGSGGGGGGGGAFGSWLLILLLPLLSTNRSTRGRR